MSELNSSHLAHLDGIAERVARGDIRGFDVFNLGRLRWALQLAGQDEFALAED